MGRVLLGILLVNSSSADFISFCICTTNYPTVGWDNLIGLSAAVFHDITVVACPAKCGVTHLYGIPLLSPWSGLYNTYLFMIYFYSFPAGVFIARLMSVSMRPRCIILYKSKYTPFYKFKKTLQIKI